VIPIEKLLPTSTPEHIDKSFYLESLGSSEGIKEVDGKSLEGP